MATKKKKVGLGIPNRSISMFFRTTPDIRDWFASQAEDNKCDMVDVFEKIATLFMEGRIKILPPSAAAAGKKHLVAG